MIINVVYWCTCFPPDAIATEPRAVLRSTYVAEPVKNANDHLVVYLLGLLLVRS